MSKTGAEILLEQYFGDFGGFFVADPFTPALFDLADRAQDALGSDTFKQAYAKALRAMDLPETKVDRVVLRDGRILLRTRSYARHFNVAGQIALAATLGAQQVTAGPESREMALAVAKVSQMLNLPASLVLNRSLGVDENLVEQLKGMGCEVDTAKCAELFDLPPMYAFQAYIANPVERYFIPLDANVGPYPYPALVGRFAAAFGERLRDALSEVPSCCVVPITTGTNAIGVFRTLLSNGCTLVTVERPFAQERRDVYCGALTMVTTSAGGDTILSPELVNWWRMGSVIRLGGDHLGTVSNEVVQGVDLPVEALRAVALTLDRVDCAALLVVEDTNE